MIYLLSRFLIPNIGDRESGSNKTGENCSSKWKVATCKNATLSMAPHCFFRMRNKEKERVFLWILGPCSFIFRGNGKQKSRIPSSPTRLVQGRQNPQPNEQGIRTRWQAIVCPVSYNPLRISWRCVGDSFLGMKDRFLHPLLKMVW